MKKVFFSVVILLLSLTQSKGQEVDNLSRLVNFYKNADKECYTELIQQSMDELKQWYEDSVCSWRKDSLLSSRIDKELSNFSDRGHLNHWPESKLKNQEKVFILSVYVDWEKYCDHNFLIDLADCMHIDSLRTFIVACVDEDMSIKGFSDIYERGSYLETDGSITSGRGLWVGLDYMQSAFGRNALKTAYSLHPELRRADAIFYIVNDEMFTVVPSSFVFVIGGKLMWCDFSGEMSEYNSNIRERRFFWEYNNESGERKQLAKDIYTGQMEYSSLLDLRKEALLGKDNIPRYKYGRSSENKLRLCSETE